MKHWFIIGAFLYNSISICAPLTNLTNLSTIIKPLKFAGHWTLSAGPIWAEAYNYFSLLSEKQALNTFGTESAGEDLDYEVREYLHTVNFKQWHTITIKILKESMRDYVLNGIVCTDTIIFIHPDYYYILTDKEKKALITRTVIMIESHYLRKNALIMSAIPFVTHFLTEGYQEIQKYIAPAIPTALKNNTCSKKLYNAHIYGVTSWVGKLMINALISTLYLKYQALKTDVKTVEKMGNAQDLLTYYAKIYEKKSADAFLLSIVKEPSPQARTAALLNIRKILNKAILLK